MYKTAILSTLTFSSLALSQRLDKPALEPSLDYVKDGFLQHLPIAKSRVRQWNGWIPTDCVTVAQAANLSPNDVSTFAVKYDDCCDPWLLCRHKDSQETIEALVESFGQVPVHMRQWVRHMVALPDTAEHAYNENSTIAIFGHFAKNPAVFIHETGHSLDLHGAYADKPLSSSQRWLSQYALDTDVPDAYAQSNQVEDVAQVTVISTYDQNVPGGFASIEPHPQAVGHQLSTLEAEANAAPPGNILKAGGKCTMRHWNSVPVRGGAPPNTGGVKMMMRKRGKGEYEEMPDVSPSEELEMIEPVSFSTKEHCKHSW